MRLRPGEGNFTCGRYGEIVLNRFLENVDKKEIFTSTEMIDTDTGKTNVSSIEIVLSQSK